MEKMRMESVDMTEKNIDRIAELFPNCISEALDEEKSTPENKVYKRVVNFDILRQMLSGDVIEGDEAYEFTWVGKKAAILEANKPIRKTLRPCPEESKDWDNTENLYIEGDNLEVLKLLQESYLGKVKTIYIDPPYNTGNDFIYRDDFSQSIAEYAEESGVYDEDGNRMFRNTDTNGRFHSDWCSMMYSRLVLARNLLAEDGLIFMSIDDNEVASLKILCDEVFGADNFINIFVWQRNSSAKTESGKFTVNTEYILLYTRSSEYALNAAYKPLSEASQKLFKFDDNDGRGKYQTVSLQKPRDPGPETTYDYVDNSGKVWPCPPKGWRMKYEKIKALENDNRLVLTGNTLRVKDYWNERENEGKRVDTLWNDLAQNTAGSNELKQILGKAGVFDNPKPTDLIKRCLEIGPKEGIVLDFFSGSGSTAHAVMKLNAADGGKRSFIMVQLPEECDESSVAYKEGYHTICDVGKARIRRAGDQISAEHPDVKLDTGFRVLKLDESNMNDVYYSAAEYSQDLLSMLTANIKDDRNDLDLLFGCLLEWGLPLSMPYTSEIIDGTNVHTYNDGDLIVCFEENVPDTVIKEIARRQPLRAVFRDSSFNGSPAKINVSEIFKMMAPDTRVKVI